jgi:hypothetical protein
MMTNAAHGLLICVLGVLCAVALLVGATASAPARADTVAVDNSVLLDPYTFAGDAHHRHFWGRGYFGDGYDGYWGERRDTWGRDVVYVDCSGHRGFHSISEAVERVRPFGEVRVISGYDGAPCLETVLVGKPVRIVGDRRGAPVTIASPPGQPCMLVRTEATVVLRDVRFAGHGHDQPCIELEEGWLIARDVDIDSHGSSWAIDMGQGGGLAGADLHITTDGSGINANGSRFHLANLAIDMDQGPSTGMMLERTDGVIANLRIHGGRIGAEASPGPDGLALTNVDISETDRALRFRAASAPGAITVTNVAIHRVNIGISMGPDVRVTIAEGEISDTDWAGIAVFHGAPFIHEMHISDSLFGLWIAGGDENVELDGNRIEHTRAAPIHFDSPGPARIVHNVLECNAHDHCLTGGDEAQIVHADNTCIFHGDAEPCEAPPDAPTPPATPAPH